MLWICQIGWKWGSLLLFLCRIELIERLFLIGAFLLLVVNVGKLIELDNGHLFLNLRMVKEECILLLALIFVITGLPETKYRKKVLRWLKFFLFVCSAGGIAKYRMNKDGGSVTKEA